MQTDYNSLLNLIASCEGQISIEHYHGPRGCDELLDALNTVQLQDDPNF